MKRLALLLLVCLVLLSPAFSQDAFIEFVTANFDAVVSIALFVMVFSLLFPVMSSFSDNTMSQIIVPLVLALIVALSNLVVPVISEAVHAVLFFFPWNIIILLAVLIFTNIVLLFTKDKNKPMRIITLLILISLLGIFLFSFDIIGSESEEFAGGEGGASPFSFIFGLIIITGFISLVVLMLRSVKGYNSSKNRENKVKSGLPPPKERKKRDFGRSLSRGEEWKKMLSAEPAGIIKEYTDLLDAYNTSGLSKQEKAFILDLKDVKDRLEDDDKSKVFETFKKLLNDTKGVLKSEQRRNLLDSFWKMYVLVKELLNKNIYELENYDMMKKAYGAVQEERRNVRDLIGGVKG